VLLERCRDNNFLILIHQYLQFGPVALTYREIISFSEVLDVNLASLMGVVEMNALDKPPVWQGAIRALDSAPF
jgi:hypothetical protein